MTQGRSYGVGNLIRFITGTVDQELLLRNEYLVAENRILRNQIPGQVRLTDGERTTPTELDKRLRIQVLAEVVSVVKVFDERLLLRLYLKGMFKKVRPARPQPF